jgi:Uma2 family endonuclease
MAITDFSQLNLSRSYSYAYYLSWQFSEMVELIRGKVVQMSPAPGSLHQTISSNLHGILWNRLRKSSSKLFAAPSDVRLLRQGAGDETITTVVQPDLFVVCDAAKIDEKGCLGSPDLIVEILSPSSSRQDLEVKFGLYEEAGVPEYWVFFPAERVI